MCRCFCRVAVDELGDEYDKVKVDVRSPKVEDLIAALLAVLNVSSVPRLIPQYLSAPRHRIISRNASTHI